MIDNFGDTINNFSFSVSNRKKLAQSLEALFTEIKYTNNPTKAAWDMSKTIIDEALSKNEDLSDKYVAEYLIKALGGHKNNQTQQLEVIPQEVLEISTNDSLTINERIRQLLILDKVKKSTIAKLLGGIKYQRVKNVEKKLKRN